MTTSSQQVGCLTTSSDTITLTDTITITGATGSSSSYYYGAGGAGGTGVSTITLTGGGSGYSIGSITGSTYTVSTGAGAGGFIAQDISAIDPSLFTWKEPIDFVDRFPDFHRIQQMCETYPGLKIAYEKFVTTYRLVKDDYDAPKDKK